MKTDLIFKKADTTDLEGVLGLNSDLFKKEYKEYDRSLNLGWTYNAGKKHFKSRIIADDSFVEVVRKGDGIIGYLCGEIYTRPLFRKKAKYAELENMLVKKGFREGGVGTKLVNHFIKWCKENKVDRIYVTAYTKNNQAINFYRKFGFNDHTSTLEIYLKKRKQSKK